MTAFVLSVPRRESAGTQVSIFPGSATPSVVAARKPFWIGSGLVQEQGLEAETRFELDVDGRRVQLATEVQLERGRPAGTFAVADFPSGLDAGWHRFVGRWYERGALVLTSDRWLEFVEG